MFPVISSSGSRALSLVKTPRATIMATTVMMARAIMMMKRRSGGDATRRISKKLESRHRFWKRNGPVWCACSDGCLILKARSAR